VPGRKAPERMTSLAGVGRGPAPKQGEPCALSSRGEGTTGLDSFPFHFRSPADSEGFRDWERVGEGGQVVNGSL
jgi:hypothetical protein